ncbi:MAG: CBS domain-containing protein [Actinocrinis sp.]
MKVKEIMTTQVVTVPVTASRYQAAALLREHEISGMPVLDETGAVVGLVSEHDLLARPGEHVQDVMSLAVLSVSEDTDVDDVRHLLIERRIHRVPVLRGRELAGVVSRGDVLAVLNTEWVCEVCGEAVHAALAPQTCPRCQSPANRFAVQDPCPGS